MVQAPVGRRQLLRLLGAGALLGSVGTAAGETEGEYIVGTRSQRAVRAARSEAASVRRVLDFGAVGQAVAGRFSQQALRGLSNRPDVSYVEPDGRMYAIAIDSGDGEVPWGVDRIDAEVSHGAGASGSGVDVAVIDTGIDYDHPDLAANVAGGISYTAGGRWGGSSTDPADWNDGNGHGTHCAGTVGAVDDGAGVIGVAHAAALYGVKVLDDRGSGSWSDVAAGIEWAGKNGMGVASMSLGGGYSSTVENACAYAESQGVLLVAAAGNDGPGTADDHYPAAFTTVVSVGATDSNDDIASFSSTGDTVEVCAPGVSVASTWKNGGYNTISGTSMACPHVSGTAALLRAAGYTRDEARSRLSSTAEDIGLTAKQGGAGLVDVPAALGDTSTTDPVDGTAPDAPTDLTATGTTSDSVSLSWTASGSSDVAGYRVYRDGVAVGETVDTVYTDSGLTADTTYPYGVTAFDDAGNESGAATTSATTDPASTGGSDPTGTVGATEYQSRNPHAEFDVAWTASDTDGNLASVELVLKDGSTVEETASVDVSGLGYAEGTVQMKAHKDDGKGHTYTVDMTVTDSAGGVGTASATVTENGK